MTNPRLRDRVCMLLTSPNVSNKLLKYASSTELSKLRTNNPLPGCSADGWSIESDGARVLVVDGVEDSRVVVAAESYEAERLPRFVSDDVVDDGNEEEGGGSSANFHREPEGALEGCPVHLDRVEWYASSLHSPPWW